MLDRFVNEVHEVIANEINTCKSLFSFRLLNPQYTKPSSSTLFIKLGSSEDPIFFFVISQLFDAVDY